MASNIRVIPTPLGNSNAQIVPGSTIFDRATSDYLSRAPSSGGNEKTWTVSWWFRLNELPGTGGASGQSFFIATTIPAETENIQLYLSDDQFLVNTRHDGGSWTNTEPSNAFRDNTGWYHMVVVIDTTQNTGTDRLKIYINGELNDAWSSDGRANITQNTDLNFNSTVTHCIGKQGTYSNVCAEFNLSQFYILDGANLDASYFGFTDPLTGSWRPKRYSNFNNLNDGTVWSSNTCSGTPYSGQAFTSAFDGRFDTYVHSQFPGTLKWVPPSTMKGKLRCYLACGARGSSVDNNFDFKINGVSHFNASTFPYNASGWVDFGEVSIESGGDGIEWGVQGGNDWIGMRIIEIDGFRIVDSVNDNSCYLPLDGTGPNAFQTSDNYAYDQSGNQNNWTSNGSLTYSLDSPSGVSNSVNTTAGITTTGFPSNYATWNPTDCGDTVTLSEGKIKQSSSTWATSLAKSNFAMTAGKFYWEYNHIQKPSGGWTYMGIIDEMARTNSNADTMYSYDKAWSYSTNGTVTHDDAETAYGDGWSNGDIIGCAFDVDQGKIWFSRNGTWQNSGNPETGANPAYDDIVTSTASYYGGRGNRAYVVGTSIDTNTGTGIGELISGANGFNYTAPKGFLPMCTNNNPTGISNPGDFFKSLTYTGNNTANPGSFNNISCGFQPDIVWVKTCPSTFSHVVFDSVRGKRQVNPGDSFYYWKTDDSVSPYQYGANENLHSLYGDGFTMFGASGLTNYTGHKFHTVAWKAGGGNIVGSSGDEFWKDGKQYASAALADVGSGTITPTACSVGTTPGLSILKYTGTASAGTIAHGLNKAPECIFVKCNTQDNYVYHTNLDPTTPEIWYAKLNSTAIRADSGAVWNDTAPTDTLIHIGGDDATNESGQDILMYAWHSVPGLSKFNHYMGNGNADGNYVHCGFKPSFILIKKLTGTENWQMHTTALNPYNDINNAAGNRLFANTTAVENTQANLDILSDGFKIKTTDASVNTDATTYFYCAWAEESSSGQYGGQATGR